MTDKELKDLEKVKAQAACDFFPEQLTHTKGEWAGQPFDLLPWQEFEIIRPLFGKLKKPYGYRQYNTCYCEMPKKQGKSELAAGIALLLEFADHEPGAEIYSAACDTDQARIVFDVAAQMVENNPALGDECKIIRSTKRIIHHTTKSVYRVLSADVQAKHGLNVHGVIFDELHAQPNRDLFDVLTIGTGDARRQPVFFYITTAGYDRHSICWEQHEYARQVKEGIIKDPTFLPVLYGADEKDDWTDEKVWAGCNPSLGKIIDIQKVRDACQKAQDSPALENSFRRLRLNQWVKQETRYIPMAAWDECGEAFDPEILKGLPCYAGLDLASSTDVAAFVMVFDIDGVYFVLPHFWVPGDNVEARVRKDRVPYGEWIREGFIKATIGNVIDYDTIEHDIEELSKIYQIQQIGFDRWGAVQITQHLTDSGFVVADVGQGYKSLSPPTKQLLKIILGGKIRHGGNPVLRWMCDNVMITSDAAENVKPDKSKSTERIDGIVALIMAIDGATRNEAESVYESHGIISI